MTGSAGPKVGLGVDIGGSGMKAALVDLDAGEFIGDRLRIATPQPATPQAMQAVFAELLEQFDFTGPIGCTFPGVVRAGAIIESAPNLDPSWIGVDAASLFGSATHPAVVLLNDADSAALAEVQFGAAKDVSGVVMVLTLGTGIGSGLIHNGVLVPNTELGHLEINGIEGEHRAASRVREAESLSWTEWGQRVNEYLEHVNYLFSPDLFVLGGGVSKHFALFADELRVAAPVIPASLRNRAGIVGAALVAAS